MNKGKREDVVEVLCFRIQLGVQLDAGKGGAVGGLRDRVEQRTGEALLSAEEVAEYFGVTTTTIYSWCKEGHIPCLKIGKHWRVRREDLVTFLKEAEQSEGAGRLDRPTSENPLSTHSDE